MKSAPFTLRRVFLTSLVLLSVNVLASPGLLPPALDHRLPTPTSYQSSPSSPQQIDASGQPVVIRLTPQISTSTEKIDNTQWVHGGDVNANDVALFRRFIVAHTSDNESLLTSPLTVVGLLLVGVAYRQLQRRSSKQKTKQHSYFPA